MNEEPIGRQFSTDLEEDIQVQIHDGPQAIVHGLMLALRERRPLRPSPGVKPSQRLIQSPLLEGLPKAGPRFDG